MALLMGDLYIALKQAGADEERARAAAEEAYMVYAARREARPIAAMSLPRSARQLAWMAAVNLALTFVALAVLIGR
jgi:cytochrome bd-type quinol oxidase subunit 2